MQGNIRIPDMIQDEIDYLIERCNFSDEELEYLKYKAKDKTNVYIAMNMCISTAKVSYIARKVKNKINRVIK
jgi:hypothetical protein